MTQARPALAICKVSNTGVNCAVQLMELRLMSGDIIVTGTDGLFDNVFAEEMASLVTYSRRRGDSPAQAAQVLADFSLTKSTDQNHMSPFAYAAQVSTCRNRALPKTRVLPCPVVLHGWRTYHTQAWRCCIVQAYGIPYRGGKPDDITVLISYVHTTETADFGAAANDTSEGPQSRL